MVIMVIVRIRDGWIAVYWNDLFPLNTPSYTETKSISINGKFPIDTMSLGTGLPLLSMDKN